MFGEMSISILKDGNLRGTEKAISTKFSLVILLKFFEHINENKTTSIK